MSASQAEVETTEEDLDRCSKGQHTPVMSERPGITICVHCRQIDAAPTCQFYISPEQPHCGRRSVAIITVRGAGVKAQVFLCTLHKQVHDVTFARRRTKS